MLWVERVPERLIHTDFIAKPLQEQHAALDYAAYTSSPEVIRAHSYGRWPVEEFTLTEEKSLLAGHDQRHRAKQDFAFILLAPDRASSLGCCYILPLLPFLTRVDSDHRSLSEHSAMVTFWLRQSEQESRLAEHIVRALHEWMTFEWRFDVHFFRVNPQETHSISALRANNLREVFSISHPLPYLFFGG